jgi:amino acid adenylation domain-containing protein
VLVNRFLEHAAVRRPGKVALVCGEERMTYGTIDRQSSRLAWMLRDLGVERQDRVAILLDNSSASVIALFGILKADAVFLMLSPTMKAPKLSYVLKDCRVKTLITHSNKSAVVSKALETGVPLREIVWVDASGSVPLEAFPSVGSHSLEEALEVRRSRSDPPPSRNIDLDLATVIYTSGSTGDPKGVMLSHLNMVSAANSIVSYLENREEDIIVSALPLSFDYGLYQVLMGFKFVGTVVLERSFAYPYQVIQRIVQEGATGFPCVPTMVAILLGMKDLGKFDFSRLRYITNTAAALPPSHIQELREVLPHVSIYSMYGLTECKRVSYLPPAEIDKRPASVGRGMPNQEVWIVDELGDPVGPDVVGELVVRGAHVMRGYWRLPEETARVLKSGKYPGESVLYTGDLFKMDGEGYLYFVGRKDDMIKSRGERISPKEIEQCICGLEGVAESAVIGVPDPLLGQAIRAYVRCRNGHVLGQRDIAKHCKENLEDFMVPGRIQFVDSFPKTSTGKIDKPALEAMQREDTQ